METKVRPDECTEAASVQSQAISLSESRINQGDKISTQQRRCVNKRFQRPRREHGLSTDVKQSLVATSIQCQGAVRELW